MSTNSYEDLLNAFVEVVPTGILNTLRSLAPSSVHEDGVPVVARLETKELQAPDGSPIVDIDFSGRFRPDEVDMKSGSFVWLRHAQMQSLEALELIASHSTHAQAKRIIEEHEERGFGLYLRGFSLGGYRVSDPSGPYLKPGETLATVHSMQDLEIQQLIAESLPHEPLIAVANVVELPKKTGIPRLSLANADWLPIVERLAASAAFVLLVSGGDSPGLREEVTMLHRRGFADKTVVLRPPTKSDTGRLMFGLPADESSLEEELSGFRLSLVVESEGFRSQLQEAVNLAKIKGAGGAGWQGDVPEPPSPSASAVVAVRTVLALSAEVVPHTVDPKQALRVESELIDAVALSYLLDDLPLRAKLIRNLAQMNGFVLHDFNSALPLFQRAIEYYRVVENRISEIETRREIASVLVKIGRVEEAAEELRGAASMMQDSDEASVHFLVWRAMLDAVYSGYKGMSQEEVFNLGYAAYERWRSSGGAAINEGGAVYLIAAAIEEKQQSHKPGVSMTPSEILREVWKEMSQGPPDRDPFGRTLLGFAEGDLDLAEVLEISETPEVRYELNQLTRLLRP